MLTDDEARLLRTLDEWREPGAPETATLAKALGCTPELTNEGINNLQANGLVDGITTQDGCFVGLTITGKGRQKVRLQRRADSTPRDFVDQIKTRMNTNPIAAYTVLLLTAMFFLMSFANTAIDLCEKIVKWRNPPAAPVADAPASPDDVDLRTKRNQ